MDDGNRSGTVARSRADVQPVDRVAATPRQRSGTADISSTAAAAGSTDQRYAISRPRGDNPVTGRAVPRDRVEPSGPAVVGRPGAGPTRHAYNDHYHSGHYHDGHYYDGHYYSSHYYYYPRYIYPYPYSYGAWGLGYFYYDPYVWAPVAPVYYNGYSYGYGTGAATGELRLQVNPRDAEVYVDGYYAGQVDEFDGSSQALRLEEGEYHIEIVAAGYETIAFDVRVQPGRKINYRGDMFLVRP